jgi:membrane protein
MQMPNFYQGLRKSKNFLFLFVAHCKRDKITVSAGHLTYVSLLSLVPFIMVFFTILSAFPAFKEARADLESLIFNSFVPTAGDQVQTYMTEFVGNASGMGAIGILSLVIVALMLISNIDKTLNTIWQSKSERPLIFTFAIYWMVLTLGPLLLGSSVIISSYLAGFANYAEEYTLGLTTTLIKALPFVTSVMAFFIVYMLVPNKKISPKHAAFGALVAAVLFEASKKLFALYIISFPSYQLIYGALAVIPILFLWVYLSWVVVLVGAEVTHVLEVFLHEQSKDTFKEEDDEQSNSSS